MLATVEDVSKVSCNEHQHNGGPEGVKKGVNHIQKYKISAWVFPFCITTIIFVRQDTRPLPLKMLVVLSTFNPSCESPRFGLEHIAGVESCGEWIEVKFLRTVKPSKCFRSVFSD